MFAVCSIPSPLTPWHDAKLHFSVFHFSVLAFVQTNFLSAFYANHLMSVFIVTVRSVTFIQSKRFRSVCLKNRKA